ncbi:MAG: DedA family protein [Methylovulum sp.]|jgi:membrane protein DedA with SNARE-associated domain|nr:DedA family protein [Methylovulum sp.]
MLHDLINWLINIISSMGYLGIFTLMAMESSIFPIPSEIVMPPAGYLVQQGKMNLTLVILSGTLGSLAGAYLNYFAARLLGRPLLKKYGHYLLISDKHFDKVDYFFQRHGEVSTFIGRLLPIIRHLISLPAGLVGMNHIKFTFYTLAGAGIWVSLLTGLGYFLGHNEALIETYSEYILLGIIIFCALLSGLYLLWHTKKAPRP